MSVEIERWDVWIDPEVDENGTVISSKWHYRNVVARECGLRDGIFTVVLEDDGAFCPEYPGFHAFPVSMYSSVLCRHVVAESEESES